MKKSLKSFEELDQLFSESNIKQKNEPITLETPSRTISNYQQDLMKNKNDNNMSLFDKFYEKALNEGPGDFNDTTFDDGLGTGDGSDVTADLDGGFNPDEADFDPAEAFTTLTNTLNQLKDFYGFEDEIVDDGTEDVVDDGDIDIEDFETARESVDIKELPNSKGQTLTKKGCMKVPYIKCVRKKASGKTNIEDAPEPTELPDSKGKERTNQSNKVGGSGAQARPGASIFED